VAAPEIFIWGRRGLVIGVQELRLPEAEAVCRHCL